MTLDPAALLTIGGPTGIVGALLAVLIKTYLDARKDNREQKTTDISTDSGVLDNAKKVLELVRNETDRMELKILELTEDNKKMAEREKIREQHINQQDDIIARLSRETEFLRADLQTALRELDEIRRGNAGS